MGFLPEIHLRAKKIPKLKVTYGTDIFFSPKEVLDEQAEIMERLLKRY